MSPAESAQIGAAPIAHLSAGGSSLVLDLRGGGWPQVVHWGAALSVPNAVLEQFITDTPAVHVDNLIDDPVSVAIIPEQYTGWFGELGITGSREDGTGWATRFTVTETVAHAHALVVTADDAEAGLRVRCNIEMDAAGIVQLSTTVRNTGSDDYRLTSLSPGLSVPSRATEILDFAGRWSMERVPQRMPFVVGQHRREGRRGRTGADSPLLMIAGEEGFDFAQGEVWAVHCGWSGNTLYSAERTSEGFRRLSAGELILDGEQTLRPDDEYVSPKIFFGWGRGLDELAARFHRHIRGRSVHPVSPRPFTLNVWEAVYFDHDLDKLVALAETASSIGVERFVLDDGWFGDRRDSTRGLGDWRVSDDAWPHGLQPLSRRVHDLGMQFGLWFEPEMINLDSATARLHPDWIMRARTEMPPESRYQQALDLANDEAFRYVLDAMTAVIKANGVDYVKWDQNRDLIEAGRGGAGAGVHGQTAAAYRLMDELRARFPALEIESCSSGGARVDLGVLERTDRVWASDCIDPYERLPIQRWTSQLLPPELIGAHIGAEVAHTTGRANTLGFRASAVLFAHAGLELDLNALAPDELNALAGWIRLLKEYRGLIRVGRLVRRSSTDAALWLTGSVTAERAIYSVSALARPLEAPGGRLLLPGLDPATQYRVRAVGPLPAFRGGDVGWLEHGLLASGAVLAEIGVSIPQLDPGTALLLDAEAQ